MIGLLPSRGMRWLLLVFACLAAIALFLLAIASANTEQFAKSYDTLLVVNGVLVGLLMMVVGVQSDRSGLTLSTPRALFDGPPTTPDTACTQFAPSADGLRFLFNARIDDQSPVGITVIMNWPALLKNR